MFLSFFFFFFLEGIDFPSKHNVAPLYWSLPLTVFCQRLRQIMVLSDNSLISLLFSLVKEYLFRMNLEILILHFENKICFDVSLKQFALEFLQLLVFVFCFLFFFLGKEIICFCVWQYCLWWKYVMRRLSVSYGFPNWRAREKARSFVWEKLVSFWTLILSAWIIMNSLFSMSWL
jgi:hypothetical protein